MRISNPYEEERRKRKSVGARYGHVKRRLLRNEPLTGKTLELALDLVDVQGDEEFSRCLRNIGVKLNAGQSLSEYELHIMVDVVLLHARLC